MTGRQNYKDHFALRDASKSKARADDDGERIVHNDTTVKIGEKTCLLDFTVKSFSQDVIAESKLTVGAAAKKAEKSKIAAIEKKYIVPTAERYKLVPCAAEVTGAVPQHSWQRVPVRGPRWRRVALWTRPLAQGRL